MIEILKEDVKKFIKVIEKKKKKQKIGSNQNIPKRKSRKIQKSKWRKQLKN